MPIDRPCSTSPRSASPRAAVPRPSAAAGAAAAAHGPCDDAFDACVEAAQRAPRAHSAATQALIGAGLTAFGGLVAVAASAASRAPALGEGERLGRHLTAAAGVSVALSAPLIAARAAMGGRHSPFMGDCVARGRPRPADVRLHLFDDCGVFGGPVGTAAGRRRSARLVHALQAHGVLAGAPRPHADPSAPRTVVALDRLEGALAPLPLDAEQRAMVARALQVVAQGVEAREAMRQRRVGVAAEARGLAALRTDDGADKALRAGAAAAVRAKVEALRHELALLDFQLAGPAPLLSPA